MKIKDSFILSDAESESLLVSTDGTFSGFVRINSTARFIIECLQENLTKENILDKMAKNYNADYDALEDALDTTLETLRKINALEE